MTVRIEKHQRAFVSDDTQVASQVTAAKPKTSHSSRVPPCPAGQKPLVDGALKSQTRSLELARNQATYAGVKRTLEQDPSQAERLISERLRGSSATDRAIVMRAVSERGNTGVRRYADAESVLKSLQAFTGDERGDILGIMKAGARFESAVKQERTELSVPVKVERAPARPSTADFKSRALANVRAQAAKVNELGPRVHRLSYEIGRLDRGAEYIVGVGSAAGLVGATAVAPMEAVLTGSTKPFGKLVERADAAGAFMCGELSDKIAAADATTVRFFRAGAAFTDAQNRYETAVREGDYPGMISEAEKMDAAAGAMKRHAESLATQAQSIAKWNGKFEHATFEAAIQAVLTGASVGWEFKELLHPPASVAKTIVEEGIRERLASGGFDVARKGPGKPEH